jgi:hypothetical protein
MLRKKHLSDAQKETKENEKINLLSHKRVLYIVFSQLLPMLIVILVII